MSILLFVIVFIALNLVLLKWIKTIKIFNTDYIPNIIKGRYLVDNSYLEDMRKYLCKKSSKF